MINFLIVLLLLMNKVLFNMQIMLLRRFQDIDQVLLLVKTLKSSWYKFLQPTPPRETQHPIRWENTKGARARFSLTPEELLIPRWVIISSVLLEHLLSVTVHGGTLTFCVLWNLRLVFSACPGSNSRFSSCF